MVRNEELEDFLKRVENYDSQRRETGGMNATNHGAYSEESIERARQLLQNGIAIVDDTPIGSTLATSDLAYKSAYNYEKTFSPRRVTSQEKTYVVSERDYLLLQSLKAKEKSPPPLPSRGRARELRLERILAEEKPPALPTRKYYSLSVSTDDSYNAPISADGTNLLKGSKPPVPPKSRSTMRALEIRTESEAKEVSVTPDSSKEEKRPSLGDEYNLEKKSRNSEKSELKNSPRRYNLNAELESSGKIAAVDSSMQHQQVPQPLPIDFLDSVRRKQVESHTNMPSFGVTRTSEDGIDGFTRSVAKSTTQFSPVQRAKPIQFTKNGTSDSESFISSAIKVSPNSHNLSENHISFTVPSNASSESFLSSALKVLPPAKPIAPPKPIGLTKQAEPRTMDLNRPQPEKPLKPAKLATKIKPKVPPKKSEITIPKLRHVGSPSPPFNKGSPVHETNFADKLKKVEPPKVSEKSLNLPEALAKLGHLSRPPASPKRQDEVPEALTKLGHLSKPIVSPKPEKDIPEALTKLGTLSRPTISPKRENDIPEALSHLERLNKVSKQPPVPARKISMAEALQRAQELKSQKSSEQATKPDPEQPKDMKTELGAVLMAQKLRSTKPFLVGQSHTEPSSNNSSTTSLGRTQSTPVTTFADQNTTSNTLMHATKKRAKGPKRKLPSNVKK
ncbi:BSP1 (YPR171W) [Zygosaccharomyces parabailii]|nr:BSP1 (YPR171W) [Zygosaccharomyces parabailii]CDH10555.1 uncharacterized protein ZBAI_02341 [Zygosaccharomyces bailii ISA1307]